MIEPKEAELQINAAKSSLAFMWMVHLPSFSARHIINNMGTINATLIIGPSVKEMSRAWVDQESYSVLREATVDHDDSLSKN